MNKKIIVNLTLILILSILSLGCATVEKGTLLGSFIGTSLGLAVGSQHDLSRDQRISSATTGALIGGAIGYFATKEKLKSPPIKKMEPLAQETTPKLKLPKARKIWVPDQIIGDEFVSGHWKYLIDQPAAWAKEE